MDLTRSMSALPTGDQHPSKPGTEALSRILVRALGGEKHWELSAAVHSLLRPDSIHWAVQGSWVLSKPSLPRVTDN